MPTLYLIDCSDGAVRVLSEYGQDRWLSSRWSPLFLKSRRHVLLRGPEGWRLQDQSPGPGYGRCLLLPAGGGAGSSPPLGAWRSEDGKHEFTLSDRYSDYPPLQDFKHEELFISMTYVEKGDTALFDSKVHANPFTDDGLERCLSVYREVVVSLARRPGMTLVLRSDMQEALVPCMRHVRRFVAFGMEIGELMDIVVRGHAMIFKPKGITGHACLSMIKWVQRLLPAHNPETIAPCVEEANRFLAQAHPKAFEDGKHVAPGIVPGKVQSICRAKDCQEAHPKAFEDGKHAAPGIAPGKVQSVREVKDCLAEEASPFLAQARPKAFEDDEHGAPGVVPGAVPRSPRVAAHHPGPRRAQSAGSLRSSKTIASDASLTGVRSGASRRTASQRRPKMGSHPDLEKLEVPVWVAMGYTSRRTPPASKGPKGCREPMLCGCF